MATTKTKAAAATAAKPAAAKVAKAAPAHPAPVKKSNPTPSTAPAGKSAEQDDCVVKFQRTGNVVRATYESLGGGRISVDLDTKDIGPAIDSFVREIKAAAK